MLMKLIWKIFPPYEVKVTKAYIKDFFSLDETQARSLTGAQYALETIKAQVLQRVSDVNSIIHAVRIDKIHPEHIALIQILNTLDSHIGSGNYHIYRNMLKDDGKELLRIMQVANKIAIEKDYLTNEEVNKSNAELNQQISKAG